MGDGVTACYEAYGDVFWLKDKKADGHHVDAVWFMNWGDDNSYCHSYAGSGAGWRVCSFADVIPENDELIFRGGVGEGPGDDHEGAGSGDWGPILTVSTS